MKRNLVLLVLLPVFFVGCQASPTMKSFKKVIVQEVQEMYKEVGLELEEYKNKEVKVTRYFVKEKQRKGENSSIFDGDNMYISIFEVEGIIIGGHGHLEDWSPGIFSLEDKERLRSEGVLY